MTFTGAKVDDLAALAFFKRVVGPAAAVGHAAPRGHMNCNIRRATERGGAWQRCDREFAGRKMSFVEVLVLLLIAALCGAVAQTLTSYSHGGCLVSVVLGFIGALVGTWLARLTGLPDILSIQIGETRVPILWTIIGAALFCAVLQLLGRRRY